MCVFTNPKALQTLYIRGFYGGFISVGMITIINSIFSSSSLSREWGRGMGVKVLSLWSWLGLPSGQPPCRTHQVTSLEQKKLLLPRKFQRIFCVRYFYHSGSYKDFRSSVSGNEIKDQIVAGTGNTEQYVYFLWFYSHSKHFIILFILIIMLWIR